MSKQSGWKLAVLFSWNQLRRSYRSGDVMILVVALGIAVAATGSVSMLTDRVQQAMLRQGGEAIGGDLMLRLRAPLDERRHQLIQQAGLDVAHTAEFPSVALNGDERSLVSVKAVDAQYPLRGQLTITESDLNAKVLSQRGPKPGNVWLDRRAMIDLKIGIGETIGLGDEQFVVAAQLLLEPDRSAGFLGLAPRVMMNRGDLEKTGLIGPGSRVTHRSLLAGDATRIEEFRQSFQSELQIGENLSTPSEAQPALRSALDRAGLFLNLAAMVSVILSGVAVAFAAWQQARARMDEIALLKSLGAQKGFLRSSLLTQWLMVTLFGIALGLLLAILSQWLLAALLVNAFNFKLPPADPSSFIPSAIIGVVISLGFGWPALAASLGTTPARVFQRALAQPSLPVKVLPIVAVIAVSALLYWIAGDIRLAITMLGGLAVAALIYALAAGLFLRLLNRWSAKSLGIRLGIRSVTHRPMQSQFLVMVFGIGLTVLFILGLVRNDLVLGWQADISNNAPNRFILNARVDQLGDIKQGLELAGVVNPVLYPMVRARLVAINDRDISSEDFSHPDAGNLLRRELNLSWAAEFKQDNELIEGQWWSEEEHAQPWASIGETVAKRLNLVLGDRMQFDLAGERFSLEVRSIRRIRWDSMEPNFYIVATPKAMEDYPATWISSFHLPESGEQAMTALIREHPNVGLLDLQAILLQLQSIADRAILAVELVFGFALLAGIVVLYAAIRGSHPERLKDTWVMRSFGASNRTLWSATTTEFAVLGAVAALLAVIVAQVVAALIAQRLLDQPYRVDLLSWFIAVSAGIGLITASGALSARSIIAGRLGFR